LLLDVEEETALSRRAKSLGEYKKQIQPETEKKAKKTRKKKTKKVTPKQPTESKSIIITKWLDQKILSVLKAEKSKSLSVPQIRAKIKANKEWAEQIKGLKIADSSWNQSAKRLVEAGEAKVTGKEGRSSLYASVSAKKTTPKKTTPKKKVTPKKTTPKKTYTLQVGRALVKDSKGNALEFSSKAEVEAWFEKSEFNSTHTKPKKVSGQDKFKSEAKKTTPKKTTPKKTTPKKTTPKKKVTPKKVTPKKVTPKKPSVKPVTKKPSVKPVTEKPMTEQEKNLAILEAMLDKAVNKL